MQSLLCIYTKEHVLTTESLQVNLIHDKYMMMLHIYLAIQRPDPIMH